MPDIPSGSVAILFTDIEGYSSLTEREPDRTAAAVRRHEAIVREEVAAHDGYVFKTMGDAFCVAFHSAPQAVAAAAAAQLALSREDWSETVIIRVRMAVHVGPVECRDNDYFGATVIRAARLLPLAHGAQTILSDAAQELSAERLPEGSSLRLLGRYRLKDLLKHEQVWQLNLPGQSNVFPPLHAVDTSLPVQLTTFFGRTAELTEIADLLKRGRMLTLTGTGGCGKTRLSLQAAEQASEHYSDGVRYVELASIAPDDNGRVASAIVAALTLKETPGVAIEDTIVSNLLQKSVLLVLDNCEHVRVECALLANKILQSCAKVRIMTTSREALGIPSEIEYLVQPLLAAANSTFDDVAQNDAVQLFVDRARMAKPRFELSEENYAAVNSICARLDGLPIAIELAAANIRMLSPRQIDQHLFRVLKSTSPTQDDRHRTLESLMDWSYLQLPESAQALLRRLSVFPGSWDFEAAELVCAGGEIATDDVFELLAKLRSASLLVTVETDSEDNRIRMLETVRQYAAERRSNDSEHDNAALHHRLIAYYLSLAEEGDSQLITSNQATWIARLRLEYPNIRCALGLATAEAQLRLAGAMARFWQLQGQFTEGRNWLQEAITNNPAEQTTHRTRALNGLAVFWLRLGDFDASRKLLNESRKLCKEIDDTRGLGDALNHLGTVDQVLGDLDSASRHLKASHKLRMAAGDRWGAAASMNNLGIVEEGRGDAAAAIELWQTSRSVYLGLGDQLNAASVATNIAHVYIDTARYEKAKDLLLEALIVFRTARDLWKTAFALLNLGETYRHLEGCFAAVPFFAECAELMIEVGDNNGLASCVSSLADMTVEQEHFETGVTLFAAHDRIIKQYRIAVAEDEKAKINQQLALAKAEILHEVYEDAWSTGKMMSALQAVNYALVACREVTSMV